MNLEEGETVLVRFGPEGEATYRCPCIPQAKGPLPITYCYCCGGHVKHHLQTTLDRRLAATMLSCVLSSGGKPACAFRFEILINRRTREKQER